MNNHESSDDDEVLSSLLANDADDDDDVLMNLLANNAEDDEASNKNIQPNSSENSSLNQKIHSSGTLKDVGLDFTQTDETNNDSIIEDKRDKNSSQKLINDNEDSSDEEDKKYFENQRFTEYGKSIKDILKKDETEKVSKNLDFQINKQNSLNSVQQSSSSNLSTSFKTLNNKNQQKTQHFGNTQVKKDVYSDPFFGLRIIRPKVSTAELTEKMQGRLAITVSRVKMHLQKIEMGNSSEDWVIAGVLMNQASIHTSQKGNQYCIWKLTDLSSEMKAVSVFLFKSAYTTFWKLPANTVLGILNPSSFESKDNKDEAALSVDNDKKIMILGTSKDLGKCKSVKKNGDTCTMPVNLRLGEHCIYHVKQEYGKFSRRAELLTNGLKPQFGLPSNSSQKKTPFQQSFTNNNFNAVPAVKNEKMYQKDRERLALLRGVKKPEDKSTSDAGPKIKVVESTKNQAKKDFDRLSKLRNFTSSSNINLSDSPKLEKKDNIKLSLPTIPILGAGMKDGTIDLSENISKDRIAKAKQMAISWVKKNGVIKKKNPNALKPEKKELLAKGIKRKRENEEQETLTKNEENVNTVDNESKKKSKFQEIMEMQSAHSDLIEVRQNEETEKYFNKLEIKEKMEEKMLTTFKVDCKAVYCKVCKYVAFSSSDLCKKLQHPIKVIDTVKRFFKCGDCGNRTVTLDRIPTESCGRCFSSKWIRAAMMDEKRTEISSTKLSVRGGEETFIGSVVGDKNINLLVPDTD